MRELLLKHSRASGDGSSTSEIKRVRKIEKRGYKRGRREAKTQTEH